MIHLQSKIYLDKIKSKGLRITPLYISVNTQPLSFVSDFKDCLKMIDPPWSPSDVDEKTLSN